MRSKNRYLLGLLLVLSSPGLLCAAPGQQEEAPWYEIELIIFANNDPTAQSDEFWPADPGQPSRLNTIAPATYQQLPDKSLQLSDAYSKLAKTNARIEPLLHMAWRQQVKPPETAKPLYLVLPSKKSGLPGQTELPRLEGRLKISIKRYLHVNIDMVLRDLTTPSSTAISMEDSVLTSLSPYPVYRMQMHRRMRSKELHYIDHPLMGVLITARRYKAEKSPPETKPSVTDETTPATTPRPNGKTAPGTAIKR